MSSVKSSSPNPEISDKDSSYLTIGQYKVSKEKLYTYLRKNYGVVELARLVDEKLLENIRAVCNQVIKVKPQACKGVYIKNCVLSSTMGPSIKMNPESN
jgi:hypothetical protein